MVAPITALYGALMALFYLFLCYRVARTRMRFKTGIGTGGHTPLELAVRVHANFAEYVPLALVLLLLLEINQFPVWLLHSYGIALIFARSLHAYGLSRDSGRSFGRFYGTLATWLIFLAGSLALLVGIVT